MRLILHRLRHDEALRTLAGGSLALSLLFLLTGIFASSLARANATPLERADRLAEAGSWLEADSVYLEIVLSDPDDAGPLLSLITNRARANQTAGGPVFRRAETRSLWREAPEPVRVIADFWQALQFAEAPADPGPVERLARRRPPVRYANSVLAQTALLADQYELASDYFEQEGLAHPAAVEDLRAAVDLRYHLEDYDWIRRRIDDPRYSAAFTLSDRMWLAVAERNWVEAMFLLIPAQFEERRPWPVSLALIAAVLWFLVAARMGQLVNDLKGRLAIYLLAFVAGVLSIYPTLLVVVVQDHLLGFTETGNVIADAIYFIFGVGLREEAMKFLAFLILTPLLRRRSRLEVLMAGVFVGLGFAAEENVGYFHQHSLGVAITRFLTANFLHMALTGLVALSWHDRARLHSGSLGHFAVTFPLAVLFHGVYDLFLSIPALPEGGFLAMGVFVVVSFHFLEELKSVIGYDDRKPVLYRFVFSIVILAGFSYVYAAIEVGPLSAVALTAEGLLGVIFLILVFFRQLAMD